MPKLRSEVVWRTSTRLELKSTSEKYLKRMIEGLGQFGIQ